MPVRPTAYSGSFSNEQLETLKDGQEIGGSSISLSEASDAKAKQRDKNKRAQKRLRERKKARNLAPGSCRSHARACNTHP